MFKNTVVKAPAGSGKTTALVERYLQLLESGKDISEIVAITFTNKAAGEMLERILNRLLEERLDLLRKHYFSRHTDFRISTIHSFFKNLLLVIDPFAAGSYRVITEKEDEELFLAVYYQHLEDLKKGYSLLPLLSEKRKEQLFNILRSNAPISSIWAESMLEIASKSSSEITPWQQFFAETAEFYLLVYEAYEQLKESKGLLTYADMVYKIYRLLRENFELRNDLLAAFNERITAILVDEFQDTDYLQWETIKMLAEDWLSGKGLREVEDASIFLIGDPMQSIYGFRGADPGIISSVVADFSSKALTEEGREHFEVVTKNKNYRSLPAVIGFINALFESLFKDTQTSYEPFEPVREDPEGLGTVVVAVLENDALKADEYIEAEADYIARKIKDLVGSELVYEGENARRVKYEDIAVLLKAATKISVYERKLAEYGIPYVSEETGFTSLKPFEFLRTFFLLADPYNGEVYLPKILHLLEEEPAGYESLEDFGRQAPQPVASIYTALKEFERLLPAGPFPAFRAAVKILEPLLYKKYESEREILQHSVGLFEEIFYTLEKEGAVSAAELTRALQGKIEELTPKISHELNAVTIMTIHKAKGLEFPVVFAANLHSPPRNVSFDVFTSPAFQATRGTYHLYLSSPKKEHFYEDDKVEELLKSLKEYHQQAKSIYGQNTTEEEKRLFYVAFTRARDKLFICLPQRTRKATTAYKKLLQSFENLDHSLYQREELSVSSLEKEEDISTKTGLFGILSGMAAVRSPEKKDRYDFTPLLDQLGYSPSTAKRLLKKANPPSRRLEAEKRFQPGVLAGKLVHEAIAEYGQGLKTRDECLVSLRKKMETAHIGAELVEAASLAVEKVIDWLDKEVLPASFNEFELAFLVLINDEEFREGRIDLLYLDAEGTYRIVDFKFQEEGEEAGIEYAAQLESYVEAVKAVFKDAEVRAELKFLK